ncbi:MAG: DEAD/DEAH box helicase [Nitratireductor sp.]|nr:DEAD/DEAH box helicase [Nitratireductor sp.]
MTTFKELGLAEPVLKALSGEGYDTPTPIQAQAIPAMLENRDVLGIAQTGTGKTAAFVLPQLDRLARMRIQPPAKSATVLLLTPTRELAAQIAVSIRTYGRMLKPSIAVIIGGARPGPQVRTMAKGVDFLVATPGRLYDHMQTGAIRLDGVATVILDEADQMMDLGFLPAIRKILAATPQARQTLLFSATMPKQIRSLANDFQREAVEISVTPASRPIERIEQSVMFVEKANKGALLASLLQDPAIERAVVFTRTKHGADKLCRQLARSGIEASAIHGNKSQSQRVKTLDAFRGGDLSILVATDIAARGIDIDDVTHVFNYDLPEVPEVYVHRIGRTARAGRAGHAVAFCDTSERSLLRAIEKLTGIRIPVREHDFSAGAEALPVEADPAEGRSADSRSGDAGETRRGKRRKPRQRQASGGTSTATQALATKTPSAKASGAKASEDGEQRRPQKRRPDGKPGAARPKKRWRHGGGNEAAGESGKAAAAGRPAGQAQNRNRRRRRKPAVA